MKIPKILPLVLFSLACQGAGFAAIWNVATTGDDFSGTGSIYAPFATIQKAIDSSSNGDCILVASGNYSGAGNRDINFGGKLITVRSSAGPKSTILDLGREKGFTAASTETNSTTIQGFTITNGYVTSSQDWSGVGIIDILGNAGLTIADCIFRDNEVTVTYLTTNAQIIAKFGGGEKVTVKNCLFYSNVMYGGSWNGHSFSRILSLQGPETEVDGCTIFGNQLNSYDDAGGTPIHTGGSGSIKNTIVWGNTPAANGNGIYTASVSYCLFDTVARHHATNIAFSGVLNTDPLFSNSNGGDFRLAVGSPAMNAGDPNAPYDPDGSQADIGYRSIFQTRNFFFWGTNSPEGRLSVPADLLNVKSIDAGVNHSVALKSDGTLVAWGGNGGSENIATVPTGLANIAEIDCGWAWTLVRRENGSLFAWGADDSGQISSLPSESNFVQISAGNMHGAALRSDGTVVCWGRNDMGQCNVPSGLSGVTAVIAYGHHTMALCSDGTVKVWGSGEAAPFELSGVTSIASGEGFYLALKSDGTVVAWGDNTFGQSMVPSSLNNVSKIFATADAAFAVKKDGAIVSWGNNQSGQRNIPSSANGESILEIRGNAYHVFATIVNVVDSDGDGVNDYREGKDGTDPNNASSFDPLSKGLVAYYPFNGNANDESGNANDLSFSNSSISVDRLLNTNSALNFTNNNAYAVSSKNIAISGNSNRTISGWFVTNSSSGAVGVGWGNSDYAGAASQILVDSSSFSFWGHYSDIHKSITSINDLKWHHYVCVYNGTLSNAKFYLDGILIQNLNFGNLNTRSNLDTVSTSLKVGGFAWNPGNSQMDASVDDVRIYNRALSPAEVSQLYSEESGEPNMVLVQGGTLPAGSALANQTVSAFHIARFETTWAEYREVVKWAVQNGYEFRFSREFATSDSNHGQVFTGSNYPAYVWTWNDAAKWCNAKSQMEGLQPAYTFNGTIFKKGEQIPEWNPNANGYRLPTEAEWEWAARGGAQSQGYTYAGSNNIEEVAWYWSNSPNIMKPVGGKLPNELGLYDMSGNQWEWCWDAITGGRARRGGAGTPDHCTVFFRNGIYLDFPSMGIRYVRNATGDMVTVQGGTLPESSELAGQKVQTFQIARTEVTWDEWQAVRTWAAANGYSDLAAVGAGTADNHPVQSVNWYEVLKWTNAKSQMEGLAPVYTVNGTTYKTGVQTPEVNAAANGYRLPARIEWEWSARGGVSSGNYTYSGSNDINAVAWYATNSSNATKVVGTKAVNELGIYDMSGNVWEWCWDYYNASDRQTYGGCFNVEANRCTVTSLNYVNRDLRWPYLGLRLARNFSTFPQLNLEQPPGTDLQNFQTVSFGDVVAGDNKTLIFTITNTGIDYLSGLYIVSQAGGGIQVAPLSADSLSPGGNMTFTASFTAYEWSWGQSSSVMQIYSNDLGVNPLTITLTGNSLSYGQDSDGDGMNDALEYSMSYLGFDWQVPQPALVSAYNVKIEVASPSTINLSGTPLNQDLVALGGTGFVWEVYSGTLPLGVSLNASGQISGTPTTPGNYKFTVKVTNVEGFFAYKSIEVRVVPPTTSGGGYNFANFAGSPFGFSGSSDASFLGSGAGSGGFTGDADGRTGFTGSADAASREPLLYAPSGIAVDASGNIYVSDSANNQVRKVTSNGTIQNLAGVFTGSGGADGTAWNARFNNPQGMACDASGNIYVADQDNHAIRKITASGAVTTIAGSYAPGNSAFTGSATGFTGSADGGAKTTARFNKPADVAVDASGNIYVADSGNHAIRKISTNGTVTTLAGTMGAAGNTNAAGSSARFRSPQGIAVDGNGTVYVADTGNQVIRRVTASGTVSTFAGAAFTGSASPLGGRASVTSSAHAAFIGSADSSNLPASVDGNTSTARFSYPTDITIDSQGNFYVTDSATEKIRKISSNGTVTTLGGSPDGFFYNPLAIGVAANGTLYIADAGNNRIAMGFIPAPEISVELPGGILIDSQAAAAPFSASLLQSASTSRTYTIRNVGYIDLTGLALSKNGINAAEFTLGALGTNSLSAGNSTTFTVAFSPTSGGNRTAQIAVASNDADENPFVINLAGYGLGTLDFDGDGVSDAAEYQMSSLGFEWQTAQAGMASAFLAGVNTGGLYSISQIQEMNIGTPLISKNATSGNFELTIGLQKSTNLQTFQHFSLNSTETTIEPDGRLKIRFSAPENAAFFRLKAE